jgi:hypothetical protein
MGSGGAPGSYRGLTGTEVIKTDSTLELGRANNLNHSAYSSYYLTKSHRLHHRVGSNSDNKAIGMDDNGDNGNQEEKKISII